MDHRLSLAASLYETCRVGCDIGSDHALLPVELLRRGICETMIVSDISEKALSHAAQQVHARHLEGRVRLVCADGLDAITEPVGCVSIMGMGGETAADILLAHPERLHGAVLILSVQTDPHLARRAVEQIGYHFERECLCFERGRYYQVWRCEEGRRSALTDEEARYGSLVYTTPSPLLHDYLLFRLSISEKKRTGLLMGKEAKPDELREAENALTFYASRLALVEGRQH